jgi:nucleoside-diphosphate-sugar epimerase
MSDSSTTSSIPRGKVLVTGASGHVGANLVHRLQGDGHEVRALALPGADNRALEGLDVEIFEGDLRDAEAMRRAVTGCARVFHAAAKISVLNASAGEERELYDINVIGTRNIMRAALEKSVARVVMTGSFSAVGYDPADPSKPSDEDMPFYPFGHVLPYARSKALAELEMLRAVADGLDAVIATSCACVGPHDYLPSRIGRTMIDFAHGRLRAYIPGGFMFVRAADLVEGHILAMEKGRTGHKYIIATAFHTLDDLVAWFSEITGRPAPRLRLPPGVMSSITGIYSGALSRFFPNMPQRLSPGAIRILTMRRHADISKAKNELGYQPTDVGMAVREAFEFFAREGKIPRGLLREPPASSSSGSSDAAAAE